MEDSTCRFRSPSRREGGATTDGRDKIQGGGGERTQDCELHRGVRSVKKERQGVFIHSILREDIYILQPRTGASGRGVGRGRRRSTGLVCRIATRNTLRRVAASTIK